MVRSRFNVFWLIAIVSLAVIDFVGLFFIIRSVNHQVEIPPDFFAETTSGEIDTELENDTEPPLLTLNGADTITLTVGRVYLDPGASASDNSGKVFLEIDNPVDFTIPGAYRISYIATDLAGNHTHLFRIVNVVEPKGIIYLTFDDGPGPYTAALLDVLKEKGVKATFFVTNAGDDALILREFNEGHTIGLHTASHNYAYIYQNTDNFFADLDAVQNRVERITGLKSFLMRFPGGSSNTVSRRYDGKTHIMSRLSREVAERGFTYFDWNIDSDDAGAARAPETVYNNVTSRLQPGENVVLQHDVKDYSVSAVAEIIDFGLNNGYVFAPLSASSYSAHHGINN